MTEQTIWTAFTLWYRPRRGVTWRTIGTYPTTESGQHPDTRRQLKT